MVLSCCLDDEYGFDHTFDHLQKEEKNYDNIGYRRYFQTKL